MRGTLRTGVILQILRWKSGEGAFKQWRLMGDQLLPPKPCAIDLRSANEAKTFVAGQLLMIPFLRPYPVPAGITTGVPGVRPEPMPSAEISSYRTYLNHVVSEGSTNGKISLPSVNGRLSAKQIPSSSARRHAIC
jgi:hypothetical protein